MDIETNPPHPGKYMNNNHRLSSQRFWHRERHWLLALRIPKRYNDQVDCNNQLFYAPLGCVRYVLKAIQERKITNPKVKDA